MTTVTVTFEELTKLCIEHKKDTRGYSWFDSKSDSNQGQNYIEIDGITYEAPAVEFDEYMNQSQLIRNKLREAI